MLVVETIARIRREHFGRGKGIKAIARELRVSRKVVRKVIRSGATAFTCERREQPHPKPGRSSAGWKRCWRRPWCGRGGSG
jgi:hypothetical protein